jgi:hypothetical protein
MSHPPQDFDPSFFQSSTIHPHGGPPALGFSVPHFHSYTPLVLAPHTPLVGDRHSPLQVPLIDMQLQTYSHAESLVAT